ncbi:hypothetical protein HYW94_04355 [Candidatus Uhrbacteria bacterium]|nr:hypothetical protein [Candidatus Uhrbacteria bacterium]
MFRAIEKKMNGIINHLFLFGLLSVLVGMLVMLNELMLRIFIGFIFFFIAYIALLIAYKLQGIRDIFERFGGVAHASHECKTCVPKKKK